MPQYRDGVVMILVGHERAERWVNEQKEQEKRDRRQAGMRKRGKRTQQRDEKDADRGV